MKEESGNKINKKETEKAMLKEYLFVFFISMVPLIELRVAVPIAIGMNLPVVPSYIVCIVGNMLPVPIIFLLPGRFWNGELTSR